MGSSGDEFERAVEAYAAARGLSAAELKTFVSSIALPLFQLSLLLGDMLEMLADVEHQRWSDWQRYQFSKCRPLEQEPGALVIPRELVELWQRKIATAYADLTDAERESDREQVRRYLPLIAEMLQQRRG